MSVLHDPPCAASTSSRRSAGLVDRDDGVCDRQDMESNSIGTAGLNMEASGFGKLRDTVHRAVDDSHFFFLVLFQPRFVI